jgi:AGZA family xanthine/uracil permease-like MFS transporter
LSWFGILALVQSLVNQATIGPIVFFVGLMVCEEALAFMPPRHYSAFIIGLFPSVYDWVTNVSGQSPVTLNGLWNINPGSGTDGWVGVLAWKRGALLVSMLWVAMLVQVLNRDWFLATVWAIIASIFAVVGLIHVPTAGFANFAAPFWEQCVEGEDGTAVCWEFAYQWMFFVAYLCLAGTFVLIRFAQRFDDTLEEPLVDESAHAFDDWFADAAIDSTAEHFHLKPLVSADEEELEKPAIIQVKDLEDSDLEGAEEEARKAYGLSDSETEEVAHEYEA